MAILKWRSKKEARNSASSTTTKQQDQQPTITEDKQQAVDSANDEANNIKDQDAPDGVTEISDSVTSPVTKSVDGIGHDPVTPHLNQSPAALQNRPENTNFEGPNASNKPRQNPHVSQTSAAKLPAIPAQTNLASISQMPPSPSTGPNQDLNGSSSNLGTDNGNMISPTTILQQPYNSSVHDLSSSIASSPSSAVHPNNHHIKSSGKLQQNNNSSQYTKGQGRQNQTVPQYPWSRHTISNATPFPRYGHAANYIAARDGEVFVMGGLKGSNVFGDLWVIETGKRIINSL